MRFDTLNVLLVFATDRHRQMLVYPSQFCYLAEVSFIFGQIIAF